MRSFVRTILLLALMLPAFGSVAGAQVSIGIRIGAPPQPRVLRVQPHRPSADHVWIAGYWYPVGQRYTWHAGYWTRPPYLGATWVAPHHDGQQFHAGYWGGNRGHIDHNHGSDRNANRDHHGNDRR
jgi:hypothetical protein